MEAMADNGEPRGDGDECEQCSFSEIEAGTCSDVDAEHRHSQHVEPEDRKNAPVAGVPGQFGQCISLRQAYQKVHNERAH